METVETATGRLESTLTFAWLYQRVQTYVNDTSGSKPSNMERLGFWMAIGSAGVGLLLGAISRGSAPSILLSGLSAVCLLAELGGFVVFAFFVIRRELPQFTRPRQVHASELDADFSKWRDLVAEVGHFPHEQRETRLRFIQTLRRNMNDRMGLIYGGVQRLGIFPLLIALYLQLRNWEWGNWESAFDVSLLGGLLIWFMAILYAAGWLLIGLRVRVDTYEILLQESLTITEPSSSSEARAPRE